MCYNVLRLQEEINVKNNIEQKVRRLSQQKLVAETENEILKKKLQELQNIRIQYDNIVNSRKYKLLNLLDRKPEDEEYLLGENGEKASWILHGDTHVFSLINSLFQYEPQFSGKIIIAVDKKNEKLQGDIQEYFSDKQKQYELFLTEKEYDVYEILNQVVETIDTEWFVYIDSSYTFTKSFIKMMNTALKETGCHFVNLPVRDERTDWIFSNQLIRKSVQINDETQIIHPEILRFTKTINKFSGVLNSHAVVIKKETFEQIGKFDSIYKTVQSLEIAYRIERNGLAIGNCKDVFLSGRAKNQENDLVEEAVNRLLKKEYGYSISNEIEELDEYVKKEGRLRVALIVDVENWSYHNIAKQVKSCLEDKMDVDLFFYAYTANAIQLILALKDYDIIHFMWRGNVYILSEKEASTYLWQLGMTYEEFKTQNLDKICITTSVYDHLFVEKEDERRMTSCLLDVCDEYTVSSELLSGIYKKRFQKLPLKTVTDGVDLNKFYPQRLERFEEREHKNLVIGWVGNSQFFGMQDKDLKGVNTILKPAIEELQKEGAAVERYFADRQERMISHDQMCDYYSKIDVLVCTSLVEGTPNPVLEAMACGVPVISTNVGIVSEALGEVQKQFILEERSISCLKGAILKMLDHPEYLTQCSQENLEQIKVWDWKRKTQDFKEFFEETYKKHRKDKM